jgi:hypothetical protein
MARTSLADILDVVRIQGETGSHQPPQWSKSIDELGDALDAAVLATIGNRSLSDLLDNAESGSVSGDGETVDKE